MSFFHGSKGQECGRRVSTRSAKRKRTYHVGLQSLASSFSLTLALFFLILGDRRTLAYHQEMPRTIFGRAHRQSSELSGHVSFGRHFFRRLGASTFDDENGEDDDAGMSDVERDMIRRISRLEALVSKQEVEIYRLRKENEELKVTSEAFAEVVEMLRDASKNDSSKDSGGENGIVDSQDIVKQVNRVVESFDDSMIFGTAPASVNDAADAAGAAILAAMLGGKQRMLVDVRDAELSSDPETLVQFIELAILPIAAGLEGLKSTRNRVKIVFPKVSQLLEYRRTMALAAPEVVSLSTLGFDPVERRDKLVVIVAPEPDDEEGLAALRGLLYPSDEADAIDHPVVILNYHMLPVQLPPEDFETAYHLRLLSVQYMTGEAANDLMDAQADVEEDHMDEVRGLEVVGGADDTNDEDGTSEASKEELLEAAMKHAHQIGTNQGMTRAMVIRSYPR